MTTDLEMKCSALDQYLRSLGRTLVAYSGGTDSAFLAWALHQVLGNEMLAVIADSPSLARFQLNDAIAFAPEQNIPIEVIRTEELDPAEYIRHDSSRCFHFKDELFTIIESFAATRQFPANTYGRNPVDQ